MENQKNEKGEPFAELSLEELKQVTGGLGQIGTGKPPADPEDP